HILDAEGLPLWRIAEKGNCDLLREVIITEKVDIHERNKATSATALHMAVAGNHIEILEILLTKTDLDLNAPAFPLLSCRTALHIAASRGNLEATELLLKHKASFECWDDGKATPLWLTHDDNEQPDRYRVAAALVEAGARTDHADMQNTLIAAVRMGKIFAVQRLVDAGADPFTPDEQGHRAIDFAKDTNMLQFCKSRKVIRE
ncbi:hypothetical protein MMC25_000248, partial [Agyrium rufum]|nr:hypothetical protein [Agyrium rufum]